MKKYIQSKINHTENISNQVVETTSPSPVQKKPDPPAANIQPPLPLVPPPPDIPWIPVKVKKEVQVSDDKYEFQYETKHPVPPQEDSERVEICRDFLRGTCNRTGPCRFAHKFELNQLFGIFTFCRQYQTKRCTVPSCRYVHASIFEEQKFYRTGYLPPSAFVHNKSPEVTSTVTSATATMTTIFPTLPPPPPPPLAPPPPPPPEDPPQLQLPPDFNFHKPPPPLPQHSITDALLKDYTSMYSADSLLGLLQSNPMKRPWSSLDRKNLQDLELGESSQKKCPTCDLLEICLQHSRSEMQKEIVKSENMSMKMEKLDKMVTKLDAIIMKVLKSNPSSLLPSSLEMQYDRDRLQLEKLSNLWNL